MNLTDFLSRNPVVEPESESEFEEDYAMNCIEELKQFTERNDSIKEKSINSKPMEQSTKENVNQHTIESHSSKQKADYIFNEEAKHINE